MEVGYCRSYQQSATLVPNVFLGLLTDTKVDLSIVWTQLNR